LNLRPPGPETKNFSQGVDVFNPCEWCFNRINSRHCCSALPVIFLWMPQSGCPNAREQVGRLAPVLRSCRTKRVDYIGVARSFSRTSDRYDRHWLINTSRLPYIDDPQRSERSEEPRPGIPDPRRGGRIHRGRRVGFFTYSSVHVWPFSAHHVSFLALRPSTGWHAR